MAQAQIKLTLDNTLPIERRVYDNLKSIESAKARHDFIIDRLAKKEKKFNIFLFVRILTGIVGILLVTVSVHFTDVFNTHAMHPFWALILSISVVFYTSFAFTLASYSKKTMALLFYLLWFIGVSYSIFTAVAGQYEAFREYVVSDEVLVQEATTESIDKVIQLHEVNLTKLRETEALYQNILNDLDSPERRYEYLQTWRDTNDKLTKTREDIQAEITTLTELDTQKMQSLTATKHAQEKQTIYSWLAGIFHSREDTIHLLVIVFPSVFIDLVSGLVFKFALGKKEEEE